MEITFKEFGDDGEIELYVNGELVYKGLYDPYIMNAVEKTVHIARGLIK